MKIITEKICLLYISQLIISPGQSVTSVYSPGIQRSYSKVLCLYKTLVKFKVTFILLLFMELILSNDKHMTVKRNVILHIH